MLLLLLSAQDRSYFLPKTESKITAAAAAFGPRSQLLSSENRIEHR
jgi:hypothetical protein